MKGLRVRNDSLRLAIFGDPVSHSISPLMHNYALRGLDIEGCYGRYRLKDGSKLREKFFELGLDGANITVPHKEAAFGACDELDPFAKKVGAVNTILLKDNKLYGFNTDAPGFLSSISDFGAKSVLLLGAGGTARSTAAILRDNGYGVAILNRSKGRLESFADLGFEVYTYDDFVPKRYDLVVNTTSAGLSDDVLPAPKELLESVIPSSKACIDVIYGKETPFMSLAKELKKPVKDGSEMLLYQGMIALDIFTGHRYDSDLIEKYMRKAFV